jgi:hypothetical protein
VKQLFDWLVTSPWSQAMAAAEWVFPIVQSMHFIGFALLIGTIAMTDLRLLGAGLRRQNASELARDLKPWTLAGLAMVLGSGFLMFSSSANAYPNNLSFRFKMTCLTVALLFHLTVHRRALRPATSEAGAKFTGAASLMLWSAVVFGGRMIAFV